MAGPGQHASGAVAAPAGAAERMRLAPDGGGGLLECAPSCAPGHSFAQRFSTARVVENFRCRMGSMKVLETARRGSLDLV